MRRRPGWAALLTALSLVVTGCTITTTESERPQGEITIGVAVERTGSGAVLGDGEEKAIRLVADRINAEGVLGKRLKLVVVDTKSNETEAVQQVTALADNPEVVGILGPGLTATTLPVLPVIDEKKIPLISMGAAESIVMPADQRRWSFKVPHNGTAVVELLMREFHQLGIRKIAMLAANNQFGDYGVRAVTEAGKIAKVDVVAVERFTDGDKDFTAQVKKMVDAEPQAIVISALMPGAGIAAKNLKDANFGGRVFFDPSAGAELFVAGAGKAAEGTYMVHSAILAANHMTATTPSTLAQKEFFAAYTQRHGNFSGYASYGADALNLMVEAIRKAGSTDRSRVRDALESLEYDGLTGTYKFSPSNHGGASGDGLTVLTVQKGGWVLAP